MMVVGSVVTEPVIREFRIIGAFVTHCPGGVPDQL